MFADRWLYPACSGHWFAMCYVDAVEFAGPVLLAFLLMRHRGDSSVRQSDQSGLDEGQSQCGKLVTQVPTITKCRIYPCSWRCF